MSDINRLIALGGTGIPSPLQRYKEEKQLMAQEERNRLAMAAQQQQMQYTGQKMDREAQTFDRENYINTVAPVLKTIKSQPIEERQSLWQEAIPMFQRMGLDASKMSPQWNESQADSLIAIKYPNVEPETAFAKVDPAKFTPESVRKFQKTKDYGDLTAVVEEKPLDKRLSVGEKAVDRAFAKEYVDWTTSGLPDVKKGLIQLVEAQKRLLSGDENLSGPVVGRMPDFAKAITHPQAIDVRDQVQEVVQRNLRAILGGQFAKQEGEQLIARAYNENLSEEVNARRLNRLINSISEAATAKTEMADYYERKGTLSGYKGKVFSSDDIKAALDAEDKLLEAEGGPTIPKTDEDFKKLKSGSLYIDPDDGQLYRKP